MVCACIVGGRFCTITCRQIRLAHSSVCQGSHTLAHPSDLRLGKGCKTLLSLSRRAVLLNKAELRATTKQSSALRVGRASLYEWAELRRGIPAELRSANSPETPQSFMLNGNPARFKS